MLGSLSCLSLLFLFRLDFYLFCLPYYFSFFFFYLGGGLVWLLSNATDYGIVFLFVVLGFGLDSGGLDHLTMSGLPLCCLCFSLS